MPKRIFIGSLSFQTSSEDLQQLFVGMKGLVSVRIADSPDGKSRVGHAEMKTAEDAAAAIKKLNGKEVNGKKIEVRAQLAGEGSA